MAGLWNAAILVARGPPGWNQVMDCRGGINTALKSQKSALLDSHSHHLYVRYGKRRLKSGHIAVTAIYKDLSDMGKSEQRYWHSHELDVVDPDKSDPHFQNFLARTYEGEFVDFEDPITRLREAIVAVNTAVAPSALFAKVKNVHLRLPVEQTYKSYCDAASELYKIVGPDNLAQAALKAILNSDFSVAVDAFVHSETKRPLSTLQLLERLELELKRTCLITDPLRALSKLRIAADHKVLEPEPTGKSYSREFANICNGLSQALEEFAKLLAGRAK